MQSPRSVSDEKGKNFISFCDPKGLDVGGRLILLNVGSGRWLLATSAASASKLRPSWKPLASPA